MRRRPDRVGFSPSFNDELMDFSDDDKEEDKGDMAFFEAGHFTFPTRQPMPMPIPTRVNTAERAGDINNNKETLGKKQEKHEPKPSIDDLVVTTPPEWALCSVCQEIFKRPSITRCGHTFCYSCMVEVVNRKGNCPLCRQDIDGLLSISTNYQMKQVLSGLIVRCRYGVRLKPSLPFSSPNASFLSRSAPLPSSSSTTTSSPSSHITYTWEIDKDGCNETFEFGNRAKHESQCTHARVACFHEGCLEKVKRKDIEQHMAECPYRVIKCICGEMIQFQNQEKHLQTCPETSVECKHKCGTSFLLRQQEEHFETCPNVELSCPHSSFGCKFKGKRDIHSSHLDECQYEKLKDFISYTQEQIRQLVKISHSQQKEIVALKTALAAQAAEITSLRGNAAGLSNQTVQNQRPRASSFRTFLNNPFNDLS